MFSNALNDYKKMDWPAMRPAGFFLNFREAKIRDIEIVNGKSGWKTYDSCPICGSREIVEEFAFDSIAVVCCPECQHRYTDKYPVDPSEIYGDEQYKLNVEKFELNAQEYRKNRFNNERVSIIRDLFPDTERSILDVGCGWGYFLAGLKDEGFDCHGIELSKPVAEIASKEFGIPVYTEAIEQFETDHRFDLITMFGVIEHLVDPGAIIAKCSNLLTPDGMVLMFTPNFDSYAVHRQRENANQVYPGQHIQHFTKTSMERMAVNNGMTLKQYCTKGLDCCDLWAQAVDEGDQATVKYLETCGHDLQAAIDQAECANHMRVIFAKDQA